MGMDQHGWVDLLLSTIYIKYIGLGIKTVPEGGRPQKS